MNPKLLYLPTILTLVVGAIWLAAQQREIASIEQENAQLLRETGNPTGFPARRPRTTWQEKLTEKAKAGAFDERALRDQTADFQLMTTEQVVVVLDEIATMDLPEDTRSLLKSALLKQLAKTDPQLALTQMGNPSADDEGTVTSLREVVFKNLLKSNPAAAQAWLDQQIAAGSFESKSLDGRSPQRIRLESALLSSQFANDPAAAETRIAAMSVEDARATLRDTARGIETEDQAAFAKIVRAQLPETEHAEIFSSQAIRGHENLATVSDYLNRISATPAERQACVQATAQIRLYHLGSKHLITPEQINGLRNWIGSQVPEALDRLTGEMLGRIEPSDSGMDFATLSKLAEQYHKASGNDEVITAFLKSDAASYHTEEALLLAGKIRDPQRRAEILAKLK